MKSMNVLVLAATLAAAATAASAIEGRVAGESLDDGLGSLPHYSAWLDKSGRHPMKSSVPGESLDDGLGSLPHYSQWLDKTGRDPLGRVGTRVVLAR